MTGEWSHAGDDDRRHPMATQPPGAAIPLGARRRAGRQPYGAAIRCLAFLITAWLTMPAMAAEPFVVIVNPQAETTPDLKGIRDIYLGRNDDWIPLELLEDNPLRRRFHEVVTGRSPAQLRSHWSRQVFTGRGYPPEEIETQEAVRYLVAREPAAIGYISPGAVTPQVKVIYRHGEPDAGPSAGPGQPPAPDAP